MVLRGTGRCVVRWSPDSRSLERFPERAGRMVDNPLGVQRPVATSPELNMDSAVRRGHHYSSPCSHAASSMILRLRRGAASSCRSDSTHHRVIHIVLALPFGGVLREYFFIGPPLSCIDTPARGILSIHTVEACKWLQCGPDRTKGIDFRSSPVLSFDVRPSEAQCHPLWQPRVYGSSDGSMI